MAAYSHGSASNVLADILLARIPVAERNTAVKDVAAQLTHRSDTATTELVASLLERCPDHDAAESLHRVLMSLVASGEFDSPVRLCLNYPSVRSLVLGHIHDQLRRVVKSLMRRPKGTGFVTDVSPVVSDPDTDSIIREDLEDQISTSLHYLSFLRCLFLQATLEQKIPVSKHLLSSVFILSLCSHIGLGARADETIVPLLNALASNGLEILGRDAESSRELDEDLDKLIGFCTSGLIDSANRRGAKATAFAMWLRWLDMPGERPLRQATIQKRTTGDVFGLS
ncbi:hypothetical protein H2203_002026 [Taxawa tesnikishii (nom. ined.)]|nr:hypothetical protein H2203_002026 [Dothideales sp. JES 119]